MRTGYLFLCGEQATHEFNHLRFLEARRGLLKLFNVPSRRFFGIQILPMMGMTFGFFLCLIPVSVLFDLLPSSWQFLRLTVVPVFILWVGKTWQISVQIGFRYSKGRSNVGTDVQVGEVKFGFLRHKLHVAVDGRQTILFLGCRRRTLSDALLVATRGDVR